MTEFSEHVPIVGLIQHDETPQCDVTTPHPMSECPCFQSDVVRTTFDQPVVLEGSQSFTPQPGVSP
jgi:hypothetical protein